MIILAKQFRVLRNNTGSLKIDDKSHAENALVPRRPVVLQHHNLVAHADLAVETGLRPFVAQSGLVRGVREQDAEGGSATACGAKERSVT